MNDQGDLDQLCIHTIRSLSMDAIQQANSGHPGTPMALSPVAYRLWQRFLPDVSARVAVEEASTLGWAQYVGLYGTVIWGSYDLGLILWA
jgi:transketolase